MNILTRYILKKYLINFIIVLISMEIFFVGIDFLQNFNMIPKSANLQLLYILYNTFFTLTLARFGLFSLFLFIFISSYFFKSLHTKNSFHYLNFYLFLFIGFIYGSSYSVYNIIFLITISLFNMPNPVFRK